MPDIKANEWVKILLLKHDLHIWNEMKIAFNENSL